MEEPTIPNRIPIFPLPNVVFFPGTLLPLHIFEDRYRRMVRDCLEGERHIGMMLIKPGWATGPAELHEIGGVGRITRVARYPDGRFDIDLWGLCRYRISSFVRKTPYLLADVELIQDPARPASPRLNRAAEKLARLFEGTLYKHKAEVREMVLERLRENRGDPLKLSNYLGSLMGGQFEIKQRILESSDPAERIRLLTAVFRGEQATLN